MPDTAAILNEAYGLIEQGELSSARTLLQPLLESDSQNPDVWWLYTHAAADASEGRRALDRVLALDPQYPGAPELSEQMGPGPRVLKPLRPLPPTPVETAPVAPAPLPVTPASPVVTTPLTDPDFGDEDFDGTEVEPREGRRFPSLLMIAGLIIIVVGVLWFAASMMNQPVTPTPTAVADLGTPIDTTPVDLTDTAASTDTVDLMSTVTDTDLTVPVATSEVESFAQTATALVAEALPTTDFSAQVVTEESGQATLDPFVQTATAFVVAANETMTFSALATEESALATFEAQAVVTDESALATSESLLPLSTEAVLATEAITPESTVAVLATEELIVTEAVLVTPEPVATEDLIVTPDVVATEDMIVTPDVIATEDVIVTPDVIATEELIVTPDVVATEDLIVTPDVVATEETGLILTDEATPAYVDVLAAKLEALNVTRDNIVVAQTSLGPTLIVEVCAVPVAGATTALVASMNALAETVADVPEVEAVGVNLACDDTRARVIAVSAFAAAAYGNGEIDARTFRQGWQPTDLIDEGSNG